MASSDNEKVEKEASSSSSLVNENSGIKKLIAFWEVRETQSEIPQNDVAKEEKPSSPKENIALINNIFCEVDLIGKQQQQNEGEIEVLIKENTAVIKSSSHDGVAKLDNVQQKIIVAEIPENKSKTFCISEVDHLHLPEQTTPNASSSSEVSSLVKKEKTFGFCEAHEAIDLLKECKLNEKLAEGFAPKRENYLGWSETFMGLAMLVAQRSKDPVTQVGCSIIQENHILNSIGYNGMPRGCHDDEFPWGKHPDRPFLNKHSYVCHAEENAILNAKDSLAGNVLYSTLFPCNRCAKMIIQVGISEVIYLNCKPDNDEVLAAKLMFAKAGIKIKKFISEQKQIVLNFP